MDSVKIKGHFPLPLDGSFVSLDHNLGQMYLSFLTRLVKCYFLKVDSNSNVRLYSLLLLGLEVTDAK